jgi:ribokinase
MPKFDIVTFGSAVIDTFIHTDVYEKKDFISYPVGEKILIENLKFSVGGGGTNTAVAFSRLGLKTGCICGIGDDVNGMKILQCLKKEKVKFIGKLDLHEMSGYSAILDSRGGERTILTYKGANNGIKLRDLRTREIKTKWLYYSALLGNSFKTQKKLARIFYKRGTKIAFNPSSYIINNEDIRSILRITEVLILNKEEAEMLKKRYEARGETIKALRSLGPKIVIITNKDYPVVCYDGKQFYYTKPHKIKVVERTGAGDAFASGFVAGRIVGWPINRCLKLALLESEAVIMSRGAKNNLIRMKLKR